MQKLLFLIFSSLFLALIIFLNVFIPTLAQNDKCANPSALDLIDIQSCLDNLSRARDQSVAATAGVQKQVDGIKSRVLFIENDLVAKQKNIEDGYVKLEKQTQILNNAIRNYYISTYHNSPFLIFLSAESASQITQLLAYQQATTNRDKAIITNIASTIQTLQILKEELEREKIELAAVKIKLDKVVADSRAYQAVLSSQIAQLSARQQQILAQRLSSLGIPLFASAAGSCSSDLTNGKVAGFSGGFGLFTYGVPNRVGLNQYGAFGRAKSGQNYTQILEAYYSYDSIAGVDQGIQIHVSGNGIDWTGSLEDYVKRIYEVPDSWGDQGGMEAIKAQAIAARSYVLAYTNNGQGSICPTEQCQVFQTGEKGGNWSAAVNQTAGQVMIQGGNPIKAWFSSTHGGYTHSSGDIGWNGTSWTKNAQDTSSSASSFADLKNNAYDKDSPWFYCNWGSRSQYGGTAWLTQSEMADIVNVVKLASVDSTVNEHLYQTDKPNPAGTDTWDSARVKQELENKGITPFNSVSGINMDVDWGSGKVSTVHVSGNAPDPAFSGSFFKTYFNLRAPANIQIVGPLYNVERN
ncbi:MAG: SpoIID/LytB domain-containing protein [Candidatus Levybacteria bacterium]|nr:SpoIID/LytB domain-containing protein [Candidatus Levybacteria bacterium]